MKNFIKMNWLLITLLVIGLSIGFYMKFKAPWIWMPSGWPDNYPTLPNNVFK